MQVSRGKEGVQKKKKTTWSALLWRAPDRIHKEDNKKEISFQKTPFLCEFQ
jgi:hypothetical protein